MGRLGRFLGAFFGAFLCVVLLMGIYSIAEDITLTTYYPAPYGAYEELTVTGNVGIGTTAPTNLFHVRGGTDSWAYLTKIENTTLSGEFMQFVNSSGNPSFQINQGDGGEGILRIYTNLDTVGVTLGGASGYGYFTGNVGIGTTSPTARLHVSGNIKATLNDIDGASPANMRYNSGTNEIGFDIAELFDASEEVEPGDVLVIDEANDLKLRKSNSPYEKGVIGIVSGSPAILFEGSQLEIAPTPNGFTKGTKPPVALAGRIQCNVSIENGPIERGDFLTSSSIPGHAMKTSDREKSFGAIIGKALEPFNSGPNNKRTGKIIILVTLQ